MSAHGGPETALQEWQRGPTASRPTYRLIQVLRAVAALMVVMHHAILAMRERYGLPVFNWLQGGAGVDIFFVISGFVMAISSAPLLDARHPARTFLARRLERVVPLYWLMTLLKIVLIRLDPAVSLNGLGGWRYIVSSFLFLPALSPQKTLEPVLIVGWTLNFEMMFYLIFSVSLLWRVRPWTVVLPALAVVSLLGFTPLRLHSGDFLFYETPLVLEFLYGVLLAAAVHWARRLAWPYAVGMAAAGFWCLLSWAWPNFSALRFVGWGLPALCIVWAAVALEARLGRRAPRWLLELGDASYSLYLVHAFAMAALSVGAATVIAHSRAGLAGLFAVLVLLSVAAGELLYRLVELRLIRWFRGRRQTAVPANA